MRRTKIVCTIGPASGKRTVLEKMIRAGLDVARLNFSHGSHEEHAANIVLIRELSHKLGRSVAILQDLSGPKVRLGTFLTPALSIKRGQEIGFVASKVQNQDNLLPLPVPPLIAALRPDDTLLLDDGKFCCKVTRCEGEPGDPERIIWTRCQGAGTLLPKKGVTAPGVALVMPAVTEKDLADLRFGLAQGVDWVAASYVRRAADLEPLKALMQERGVSVPIIAKIEKIEAVRNLDEILKAAQGIMVARGDLGVETPFDEVPIIQKRIIRHCNRIGKPVITATQMLESMIQNARPTRAEATDVANAILDGTDAVMLSGETSIGSFPVESVRTMAKIAVRAEAELFRVPNYEQRLAPPANVTEAVARATAVIAEQCKATAILCATSSGGTARAVAQFRPSIPIIGVTTEEKTYRRLALTWGVRPALIAPPHNTDAMMRATVQAAQSQKIVKEGDLVVLTAGVPVNNPGTTNLLKVHVVGHPLETQAP